MTSQLTFKQQTIQKQQAHEHEIERGKLNLRVTGQRWAGAISILGVGGTVVCLFNGADAAAVTIVTTEFVALIGLFLYRSKHELAEAAGSQPAVPVDA